MSGDHPEPPGSYPGTKILSDGSRTAFSEDLAALEAQQRALNASPDAPRIDINNDKAQLQARRILAELVESERRD